MTITLPYKDSRTPTLTVKSRKLEAQNSARTSPYFNYNFAPLARQVRSNTYIFSTSQAFFNNVRRLAEFRTAEAGWNGYNADPFDLKAIQNAFLIISQKLKAQPFITPLTDGGVQLNWRDGDREFEVEVYASEFNWLDELGQEGSVTSIDEVIEAYEQWRTAKS